MRKSVFVLILTALVLGIGMTEKAYAFFSDSGATTASFSTGFWVLPLVSLTSPNGGGTFYAGNTTTITWSAASSDPAATVTINLSYSIDGGATFPNTIATGEANDGSFSWMIPSAASGAVRVRVTAVDSHGLSQSDDSNANFTIRSPIVINEFVPNPTGADDASMPGGEWVELYNNGSSGVDVNGWILYDSNDTHELFISTGNSDNNNNTADSGETIVPAGGFLVVYRNADSDFALNNTGGDSVRLYTNTISGGGVLIDSYSYTLDPVPDNKSFARIPDGTGNFVDPIPTPGYANRLSYDEPAPSLEQEAPAEETVSVEEPATPSGELIPTATQEAQLVSLPILTEIPASASASTETETNSTESVSDPTLGALSGDSTSTQAHQPEPESDKVPPIDSVSQAVPEELQSSNPEPQSQSQNLNETEAIPIERSIEGG